TVFYCFMAAPPMKQRTNKTPSSSNVIIHHIRHHLSCNKHSAEFDPKADEPFIAIGVLKSRLQPFISRLQPSFAVCCSDQKFVHAHCILENQVTLSSNYMEELNYYKYKLYERIKIRYYKYQSASKPDKCL
ncbi:hypothetical protein OTU49_009895, partial [Cherax quadricarinatus]